MRFRWFGDYWIGMAVLLVITVSSLWLARQGSLTLYIHPRYVVFTTLLCTMGLACAALGLTLQRHRPPVLVRPRLSHVLVGGLCLMLCAALLIVRPTSLSSQAASQRGINISDSVISNTTLEDLTGPSVDYSQFTLKEWVSLLAQTSDPNLYTGKQATVVGFISPDPDNSPNILYLSRFVVTCCAVDARPVGVPLYRPGWKQTLKAGQWLKVGGTFVANPDIVTPPIVLEPQSLQVVEEPHDPYLY
ncbi:MAG TPA: TIGR03943 family protein [Candidatus Saccharimonadales bacterium]|nr:TIGR03943 family protein [Candidatus Saccharimonadales bacterium]